MKRNGLDNKLAIAIEGLSIRYSDGKESLRNISLDIPARSITVLFGPAGGGKSTLLRTINRLNDLTDVTITAPADGGILNGSSVLVAATASDANSVAGVQFQLDGEDRPPRGCLPLAPVRSTGPGRPRGRRPRQVG